MTEMGVILDQADGLPSESAAYRHPAWRQLVAAVDELRALQSPDGSIDASAHDLAHARTALGALLDAHGSLAPLFPHDADVPRRPRARTCTRWADGGFGVPDFLRLAARLPAGSGSARTACEHLVRVPDVHAERQPGPQLSRRCSPTSSGRTGIAELEREPLRQPAVRADPLRRLHRRLRHQLRRAVPRDRRRARGARRSPGARSSATARPPASARSPRAAAETTAARRCPPDAAALLDDQQLTQERASCSGTSSTTARTCHGDLPFDPFMIKQRMPYFLYSLEELRCDLTAFREAVAPGARRGAGARTRRAGAVRDPVRPPLPLPAHRQPGAQLRRPRRPAAVRLAAPAPRAALDRQPPERSTGTAVRRRGDRALRRDRELYRDGIDRPEDRALARRLRAGRRLRHAEPRLGWARGLREPWRIPAARRSRPRS